jgi:putative ABC transport system permease protein
MRLFTHIKYTLNNLKQNALRTNLTILGVAIGVASIIALITVIEGLRTTLTNELTSLGGNYIRVYPNYDPNVMEEVNREVKLTVADGLDVMQRSNYFSFFNPIYKNSGQLSFKNRLKSVSVYGVGAHYQEVHNHWVEQGRFFLRDDLARHAPVAVIGAEIVDEFDLYPDPYGMEVFINNNIFIVVGVMDYKNSSIFNDNYNKSIFIPITKAEEMFGEPNASSFYLEFKTKSASTTNYASEQMKQLLRARHQIPTGVENDFVVLVQEQVLQKTENLVALIAVVGISIVGITLLVGGIGIMNIMLVSIKERTKEIGIRIAVGASRRNIMLQFLSESVLMTLLGGIIGIVAGWTIGMLIAYLLPGFTTPNMPLWGVLLGVSFSLLVGIIFGTYPAAKASSLNPIDALRQE